MSTTVTKPKGKADAIDAAIGARLRKCRKQQKLSPAAVAEAVGVSLQQLQKYETGQNRVPCGRMAQLAEVLGKRPGYFFGDGTQAARYICALDEGVLVMETLLRTATPVANDLKAIRDEILDGETD